MAIIDARMRQKRGSLAKLDKNKMLEGEFAIPNDSDSIFVCIAPGVVLEILSKQAMQTLLDTLNRVTEEGQQIIEDFEKLEVEKVGINDDEATSVTTFSSEKIMQMIDAINEFAISIESELPTENIDTHTIYFIPKEGSESGDVYDEYIFINNEWEHIGSTEIDLSNYYTAAQVDVIQQEADEKIEELQKEVDELNSKLADINPTTIFGNDNAIQAAGDIVECAKNAPYAINLVYTGATTTNLPSTASVPSTNFNYSAGLVLKRTTTQIFIVLFSYNSAYIAYGSISGNTWSGWSIK